MVLSSQSLPYRSVGYFSTLVLNYLEGDAALQSFYEHPVSIEGIRSAIEKRKQFPTDRKLLVSVLQQQYSHTALHEKVKANIEKLSQDNCFVITTAHQPNIFTGHLYFVYKIMHAIKMADELGAEIKDAQFVPVFYMGSEDADLEELSSIYVNGQKHVWETKQTGAVGRMKVDKGLLNLIEQVSGQLTIYPFGEAVVQLLRECYQEGITIELATFQLVNRLFAAFGLVVLLPDHADLKKAYSPVMERELTSSFSHQAVEETVKAFPAVYKIQATGRDINLFYLDNNIRERIEWQNGSYTIHGTALRFSKEEILEMLKVHPERFSPNVILRPVYQEFILPGVAFIGGGGEIAYWLELKKVFEATGVPYPVLVLRNSFMIAESNAVQLASGLGLDMKDIFRSEQELLEGIVILHSKVQLSLEKEKASVSQLYGQLKKVAGEVDSTLEKHTEALQTQALKKMAALEKKMLRAEKRKFEAQQRQLHKLRAQLLPLQALQERIENFMPYYAKWGVAFLDAIYKNSQGLQQQFTVLEEKG